MEMQVAVDREFRVGIDELDAYHHGMYDMMLETRRRAGPPSL